MICSARTDAGVLEAALPQAVVGGDGPELDDPGAEIDESPAALTWRLAEHITIAADAVGVGAGSPVVPGDPAPCG